MRNSHLSQQLRKGTPMFRGILVVLTTYIFFSSSVAAFETAARAAILMDYRTGEVLFAKDIDEPLPPASMSKLMTALMVFEELETERLSLDDTLLVSEKAWRMGGSKMFVEVGDRVSVNDLLQGIIVQSGNDACIVVAEALSGSEAAFADEMNERAAALGLTNSHFKNATGWPDDEHLMTVGDLATLARKIIKDYPKYYEFYGQKEFTFNEISQLNRNPLLKANVPGVDGMKTGYTRDAGYGLVASAERDGRRLILVVAGLESSRMRRTESEKLLEYGFRAFQEYRLYEPDQPIIDAAVWLGEKPFVTLVGEDVIGVTLNRESRKGMVAKVIYDSPVAAPVQAGQVLGRIEISAPNVATQKLPLVAAESIPRAGMFGRMIGTAKYLVMGETP